MVGIRLSDGCVGMTPLSSGLRLTPRSQRVAAPSDERLIHRRAVAPGNELHIHGRSLGVTGALALDEQLFEQAVEELNPGLPLPRADRAGAADLVQDRRRALLERAVRDLPLQPIDGAQFSSSVVAHLAGVVGGGD